MYNLSYDKYFVARHCPRMRFMKRLHHAVTRTNLCIEKKFLSSIPKGDSLSTDCEVKTFLLLVESLVFVVSYSISSSFAESGTIFGQFTHGSNFQFGPCHHKFSSHSFNIDTPLVAMKAGLSFVFTYRKFAFVCPLISFTLFSINTGSMLCLKSSAIHIVNLSLR